MPLSSKVFISEMQIKKRVGCFVLMLFLSGCSSKDVTKSKLVGIYNLVYPFGMETLTLQPDNKYIQIFVYKSGKKLTHTGQWKIDHLNGEQVVLINGMNVDNGFDGQAPKPEYSDWPLGVQDWNGSIELPFNPDLDLAFHKVS